MSKKQKDWKIQLGEYKEDNFTSREAMAEEIEKDTIRVMEAIKDERKRIVGELEEILELGHGGGNWRRLIMQKIKAINNE